MSSSASMTTAGRSACACSSQNPQTDPPAQAAPTARAPIANTHLIAEVENLRPWLAIDAGCGHGSDTLWLATRGWQVTAVDFSATALAHAQSVAETMGTDIT